VGVLCDIHVVHIYLPPRQAPRASDHTNGFSGTQIESSLANSIITGIYQTQPSNLSTNLVYFNYHSSSEGNVINERRSNGRHPHNYQYSYQQMMFWAHCLQIQHLHTKHTMKQSILPVPQSNPQFFHQYNWSDPVQPVSSKHSNKLNQDITLNKYINLH